MTPTSFPNNLSNEYDRIVYVDMDGVIVDFNNGFKKLPGSNGLTSKQYDERYGENSIWDVINVYGKIKFFSGLPWMSDGMKLWSFVHTNFINVKILTALGKSDKQDKKTSSGKRMWLKLNIPDLDDEDIIMVPNKFAKRHYARPGDILIDDTNVCIDGFNRKGGIGILHKNANSTIQRLKKYV